MLIKPRTINQYTQSADSQYLRRKCHNMICVVPKIRMALVPSFNAIISLTIYRGGMLCFKRLLFFKYLLFNLKSLFELYQIALTLIFTVPSEAIPLSDSNCQGSPELQFCPFHHCLSDFLNTFKGTIIVLHIFT